MAITDARAWVEVDLDALRANYDAIRRRAGEAGVLPMVKADAYGVGAVRVVRALEPLGPWGYGVATATEGAVLRGLGVTRPVLVVSPMPAARMAAAAQQGLTASISSLDELDAWAGAAERADVPATFHVDVDTGMGRSGFDWRGVAAWAPSIAARTTDRVRWTGVFTHFHSADVPDAERTRDRWERFGDTLVQLPVPRESLVVHAAASAALPASIAPRAVIA
ncbi:MAG: alanine racemase, partial [Gemmatimonadota bacterium]